MTERTPSPTTWAGLEGEAAQVASAAAAEGLFGESGRAAGLSPRHQVQLLSHTCDILESCPDQEDAAVTRTLIAFASRIEGGERRLALNRVAHALDDLSEDAVATALPLLSLASRTLEDGPAVELLRSLVDYVNQASATGNRIAGMLSIGEALHERRDAGAGDADIRQRCSSALDLMMERVAGHKSGKSASGKSAESLRALAQQLLAAIRTPGERSPAMRATEAGLVLLIAGQIQASIDDGIRDPQSSEANTITELLAAGTGAAESAGPAAISTQTRTIVDLALRANHVHASADACGLLRQLHERADSQPAPSVTEPPADISALFQAVSGQIERGDAPPTCASAIVSWMAKVAADVPAAMLTRAVPGMLDAREGMNLENQAQLLVRLAKTVNRYVPPDERLANTLAIASAILVTAPQIEVEAAGREEARKAALVAEAARSAHDRGQYLDVEELDLSAAAEPNPCELALLVLVRDALSRASAPDGDRELIDGLLAIIGDNETLPWISAEAHRMASFVPEDPRVASILDMVEAAMETSDPGRIDEALVNALKPETLAGLSEKKRLIVFEGVGASLKGREEFVSDTALVLLADRLAPTQIEGSSFQAQWDSVEWRKDMCACMAGLLYADADGDSFTQFKGTVSGLLEREPVEPEALHDVMEQISDLARQAHAQQAPVDPRWFN